jgi:hypothetical protein
MRDFISKAEKTDIKKATNLLDRLGKFSDRINNSVKAIGLANLQEDNNSLRKQKDLINQLYQKFISSDNFRMTQRFGLLSLTESDSMLITLSNDNFICPDSDLPYLVDIVAEKDITIESPNLLDDFQKESIAAVEPIKSLRLFGIMNSLDEVLDSTINFMEEQKIFVRRKTDLLLSLKELQAELKDLNSSPVYKFTKNLESLIDTIQTEKKISVLKELFEDNLNAMDTLATRLRNANIEQLGEKLNELGQKIQRYDSLVASAKLPSRIQKQTKPVYPVYELIFSVLNTIRTSITPEEAELINEAASKLEQSLLKVLNGYDEPVYVIFAKTHINHGYIRNGEKSWEEE